MILDTYIKGVPCSVRVTHYRPELRPIISGPMDQAAPGAAAEADFVVLTRQGNPAPRLERAMRSEDRSAIEQEIITAKIAEAEQARIDAAEFNGEHA